MSNKPLPLGTPIRQKVKPLAGRILHTEYDPVAQSFKHLIKSPPDDTGYEHTFYMADDDVEVDAEQAERDKEAKAEADAEAAAAAAQTPGEAL